MLMKTVLPPPKHKKCCAKSFLVFAIQQYRFFFNMFNQQKCFTRFSVTYAFFVLHITTAQWVYTRGVHPLSAERQPSLSSISPLLLFVPFPFTFFYKSGYGVWDDVGSRTRVSAVDRPHTRFCAFWLTKYISRQYFNRLSAFICVLLIY